MKYNKVFGIDHGNGFMKLVMMSGRGIEKRKYPSVLALAEEYRDIEDTGGKQLTVDTYESSQYPGEVFTFGDHVIESNSPYPTRAVGKERYEYKHYILYNQFVIAKHVEDGDTVLVVTGSPAMERMDEETEELIKDAFEGKHTVTVNGVTKTFRVKALVKAQPLGTYFSEYLDNEGDATGKIGKDDYVGIIDIGTFTTDTAGVKKNKVQVNDVDTYDRGMDHIYTELTRYIQQQIGGKRVNNHRLVEPVRKGQKEFGKGMKKVAIHEQVNEQVSATGDYIISQLRSLWRNQDEFTHIFVTGGGAEILGDYLKHNWNDHVTIIEEQMYANALGFYRFGVMAVKHNKV